MYKIALTFTWTNKCKKIVLTFTSTSKCVKQQLRSPSCGPLDIQNCAHLHVDIKKIALTFTWTFKIALTFTWASADHKSPPWIMSCCTLAALIVFVQFEHCVQFERTALTYTHNNRFKETDLTRKIRHLKWQSNEINDTEKLEKRRRKKLWIISFLQEKCNNL